MDEQTKSLLDGLALPNLSTTALSELEAFDEELAGVKSTRSKVEYYWTTTPAVCLFALADEPGIEMITYLDADLWFFDDPKPLFDEFDGASIMIVPHRWLDRLSFLEPDDGTYNVEWLTFRRDANGLAALQWWRQQCLEWCYDRREDNKFGDQRYLDEFPARFEGVHVLQHLGGGVAPWNSEQYQFERRNGRLLIDGIPVIFYHYASFRLIHRANILHRLGIDRALYTGRLRHVRNGAPFTWAADAFWELDSHEQALHWDDYASAVAEAILELRGIAPDFKGGTDSLSVRAQTCYMRDYVVERMMPLASEWRERLQTSTPSWLLPAPVKRFREHLREIRRMVGETQHGLAEVRGALANIDAQLRERTQTLSPSTPNRRTMKEGQIVNDASGERSRLLQLGLVPDSRGSLCAAEAVTHVPFEIKRTYWVFGVPPSGERGHHAHREQQELLVAARGAFTVYCDDGNVSRVYRLDSPDHGLLLPELVWHYLDDFSPDALCLVMASGPYDPSEYVFDYDEFRALASIRQ